MRSHDAEYKLDALVALPFVDNSEIVLVVGALEDIHLANEQDFQRDKTSMGKN